MIATIVLLGLMLVAMVTDIKDHKIYNWTTYTGIIAALILSGIATLLRTDSGKSLFSSIEFSDSLLGFLACAGIMIVCFVLFQVGGGDVKLIAMMGAFLGVELGIQSLLWTFVLGGALALIVLIWKVGFWTFVKRLTQTVMWKIRLGSWGPLTEAEQKELRAPLLLGPSALMAVLIVQFSLDDYIF